MARRHSIPLLLALVSAGACADQHPINPELEATFARHTGRAAVHSQSPVWTFATLAEVGSSRLVRNDNGVSFNLRTSMLERGTAATLWIVIFNSPENCVGDCDEPDLFNPATNADVLYAAGHVIGGSGKATFAGSRRVADNSGSVFAALGLPAPGLVDARTAEIHLVVRTHGPKIRGMVSEMIRTFNGGCQHPGPAFPDPLPPELGAPGPNTCVDVQFAVHKP
jgi:hypothetical protein